MKLSITDNQKDVSVYGSHVITVIKDGEFCFGIGGTPLFGLKYVKASEWKRKNERTLLYYPKASSGGDLESSFLKAVIRSGEATEIALSSMHDCDFSVTLPDGVSFERVKKPSLPKSKTCVKLVSKNGATLYLSLRGKCRLFRKRIKVSAGYSSLTVFALGDDGEIKSETAFIKKSVAGEDDFADSFIAKRLFLTACEGSANAFDGLTFCAFLMTRDVRRALFCKDRIPDRGDTGIADLKRLLLSLRYLSAFGEKVDRKTVSEALDAIWELKKYNDLSKALIFDCEEIFDHVSEYLSFSDKKKICRLLEEQSRRLSDR